ncbi:E3 ubiquitin-protein ligase makorin isoform X1 [Nymphaea colorata]|nr:E3 ubiquitin-protein ligase makorin isoform X1 [Nymphaea colorata]XP_031487695.1 E3 ubiquitin-protein ligase makorin isoform X1 [Nymphaea colorata]XP_031487696.1 E3 ubiquitin-protein ligase makorin isoform X1 [Nymphaea colorata]
MSKRILCKYFAHGACLKGEHCEFSHDWKDQANNICTFYQKGVCFYGSRCRYDHVKASRLQAQTHLPSSETSSSVSPSSLNSRSSPIAISVGPIQDVKPPALGHITELSYLENHFSPSDGHIWSHTYEDPFAFNVELDCSSSVASASDQPICAFAAAGSCPRGDSCPHVHGDLCEICGKHCLHPYRPEEREEHIQQCQRNKKHLEALRRSQEIECCVCLDRVLSKPTPAERKFGLLSECDHPFCISCIRNWRSNFATSGMDVNSTLRACPICRKLSYFVIPSVIWFSSAEEKQEIINSYKAKLRSIDCKYFDFGNGSCPFGTSCFYKHAYRDGRIEEISLRHLGADDGITVIAKDIRLSDFFRGLHM